MDWLDEIEERTAKATPGPWKWGADDKPMKSILFSKDHPTRMWGGALEQAEGERWIATSDSLLISVNPEENDGESEGWVDSIVLDCDDAAFIAHARTDIPRLIAEIRRLRASATTPQQHDDDAAASSSEGG